MTLQDKIYAYFERDPKLHVLFVFENDTSYSLTTELEDVEWRESYRLVEFDGRSWLGTKYAIEHDWKDERVVLIIHSLSPSDPDRAKNFPLMGLLTANAEYRSEGYEQFMQHTGIRDEFATLVKTHMDDFDRERFAKILRPYFNATDFTEDVAMRGLMCGYMGESKLLTWEEIILKLIIWDGFTDEYRKKAEPIYATLSHTPDVRDYFNRKVSDYFGILYKPNATEKKWKEFTEAMKYNSITQLLTVNPTDSYAKLKVSDSLRIERLNRLMESAQLLSKQQREQFHTAYARLSADIREENILTTYGVDADYYTISSAMADAMVASIAKDTVETDSNRAMTQIATLRNKVEENSPVLKALDYLLSVASFYEKLSRLGSVIYNTPDQYIEQYTGDLYLFDMYYRQSIHKYHSIDDSHGSYTAIEGLKHRLDKEYARIANRINSEWVRCLKEKGNGYGEITKALPQQDFFKKVYDPNMRAAIIICDGFRYELAKELVELLAKNGSRYSAELSSGIAMLPTETKYCKSALLPHDKLELMDLTLSVDHKILDDTPSREAHVKSYYPDANFVSFDTVLHSPREAVRPLFKGNYLSILFFGDVDREGHGSNPRKVVGTCAEAIEDLARVINKIHTDGNVYHVFLTSDHGFLYNDMVFEEKDKLDVVDETLEKKSRYYLTTTTDEINGITKFPLCNVSAMNADVYVGVPDGTNRIKVPAGDYNFAHGGASLQETIIPVLYTYSNRTNTKTATGVSLLGRNLSIVSSRLKVQLLQNEAVSETIKERTVRCAIYNGETMVSNEKVIPMSSTNADNAAARIYDVDLTLLSGGSGLLQLRVYDTTDALNPLIKETVTDNTLIPLDF